MARSLPGYGKVTFPHCPCDARKSGHVIVSVSLRNFKMKACTDQGEKQVSVITYSSISGSAQGQIQEGELG